MLAAMTPTTGREYRIQSIQVAPDKDLRFWTCEECGSVVGPLVRHREAHDAWHERVHRLQT